MNDAGHVWGCYLMTLYSATPAWRRKYVPVLYNAVPRRGDDHAYRLLEILGSTKR